MCTDNKLNFMKLEPLQFENLAMDYVQCLFGDEGIEFEHTSPSHDGGKDIIITSINKITNYKTWVECKRHNRNIGLEEIGKNVVLVISHRINKIIFISASAITQSAKSEILNVSNKNNFEALFIDGDKFKQGIQKYPSILKRYFGISSAEQTDNDLISINLYLSEFENEYDFSDDESFILERDRCFYANYLISNHSDQIMTDLSWEYNTKDYDMEVSNTTISYSEVNPQSDISIQFFCYCSMNRKSVKFPDITFSFKHSNQHKVFSVPGKTISLEHILKVPLTGKRVTEFLYNYWIPALSQIQNYYAHFSVIYGGSGTGKSRLIEEMEICCKKACYFTKYIDCKNKTNAFILKKLISFIMEIPLDKNNLYFTEDNIYQIVKNEYGSIEYAKILCDLFVKEIITEDSVYYLKNALLYFICNPRSSRPNIVFLDNIQECDELIMSIITELLEELYGLKTQFAMVTSLNIEIYGNMNDRLSTFISAAKEKQINSHNYCTLFEAKEFDEKDARIFIVNMIRNIDINDPLIDKIIEKTGTRPFDMIMQYRYLCDNNILIINGNNTVPEICNNEEFANTLPPSINELIDRRLDQIFMEASDYEVTACKKILRCLIAFYNLLPSFFVDDVLDCKIGKEILIKKMFIKYDRYTNNLEFYHDNLYRHFKSKIEYNDIGLIGFNILSWLNNNLRINIDNREKIIFYCLIKTGQIKEGLQYGIKVAENYSNSFDFRSSYEICESIHRKAKEMLSNGDYFHFCYIYARSSWETIDINKTLDIYEDMHSVIFPFDGDIPIDEICQYYRDFINAYSHAGLYNKIERLLKEFELIPDCPIEYLFVLKNRANVFYMRTNNFYLANECGMEAYSIAKELDNHFMISTACSDIAFNYLYNKKDYENAKRFFREAICNYDKKSDVTYFRELEIYNQKAIVFFLDQMYDKAILEVKKSSDKSHRLHNKYMEAKALNYMAIFLAHQTKYTEANSVWIKVLRINEELGNTASLIVTNFNLSSLCLLQSDYNNAFLYSKKAISIITSNDNRIEKNHYHDSIFQNYIISCFHTNQPTKIKEILLEYPEYDCFYKTISETTDITSYLTDECMNYFGKDGYSFL